MAHKASSAQGFVTAQITNGEETERAYLTPEGQLLFATNNSEQESPLLGHGSIDPQNAERLLSEMVPVASVSYGDVRDGEFDRYLEGKEGMLVYHQMLTDGTVKNALNYIYGVMRSAKPKMRPASADELDIEVAAFTADQLGLDDTGVGKYPFGKLLTIFKNALIYGKAHGEIVLAPGPEDTVILDKITPIHPFNVDKVEFDAKGGPKYVVVSGEVKGTGKSIKEKKVPVWKTVTFLHDDDGSWQGTSFLRAAVAHWRVKRSLIVLINQGMERYLIGVPTIKIPKSVKVGSKEWEYARKVISDFVTRPRTGIILQPDWEFEVVKMNVSMPDAKPYLEYHDAAIARALGIDFNTIQSGEGIQNVNVSAFMDITQNTIKTLLTEFASAVNLYLIPKLLVLNFPGLTRFPRLEFDFDQDEDFSASANLLGMLINASTQMVQQSKTSTKMNAEGKAVTTQEPFGAEDITQALTAMMEALPPRFKKALGYDEQTVEARMDAYRSSQQNRYARDTRKPLPGTGVKFKRVMAPKPKL